jgi:hypothetical protein
MKHAVEMGSDAMMYMPSCAKIGLGIQKLMGRIYSHADIKVMSYA